MKSRIMLGMMLFVLAFLGAERVLAQQPDWAALSDLETVEVITRDADGSPRVTTVWLLVLDGEGYVRTGGTSWGDNVVRDRELVLRVGEIEYPMGVEFEEDDEIRERVTQAFRDKYGLSDGLVGWVRGSHPKLMRLVAR